MAFEPLKFTKNWENPEDFPTYEPDETQVRADLQRLHDETRDGLNRLVAALNDPGAAAQLPFLPAGGLTAESVQAAIEEVYAAVQSAAAGKLVDGTVTKQKLAASLLERIYGGSVWVSADTPGEKQNPDTDFPVGQLWLRPDFAVENLAAAEWTGSGCTMEPDGSGWLLTTDGTSDTAAAEQLLEQVGQAGQTVLVHLTVLEEDDHLTELTLSLNSVEQELTEDGLYETALDQTGSLEVKLEGLWPYAESGAKIRISGLKVVNVDQAAQEHPGCRLPADWAAFLARDGLRVDRTLFQQTAPGQWTAVDQAVLPVSRGGTGRTAFEPGLLLYADKTGALVQLPAPETADSLLRFSDGEPKWMTLEALCSSMGALRSKAGTYEGTGANQNLELGCTPKALWVRRIGAEVFHSEFEDGSVWLFDGERYMKSKSVEFEVNGRTFTSTSYGYIELSGSTLKLYDVQGSQETDAWYFNSAGGQYQWLAIY